MKKLLIGITLVLLLVAGCGQTTSGSDSGTTDVSNNTVSYGGSDTLSFTVPNDTDVVSMTASVSILPGSTKKTFTNATDKATIDQILRWLRNSKEIGVEKPPIGKGGYPPTLQIKLTNGSTMVVGPAINWSSKKLANGSVEIDGVNVKGYVAIATTNNSKVLRLDSPRLYEWIVNHEWN